MPVIKMKETDFNGGTILGAQDEDGKIFRFQLIARDLLSKGFVEDRNAIERDLAEIMETVKKERFENGR